MEFGLVTMCVKLFAASSRELESSRVRIMSRFGVSSQRVDWVSPLVVAVASSSAANNKVTVRADEFLASLSYFEGKPTPSLSCLYELKQQG